VLVVETDPTAARLVAAAIAARLLNTEVEIAGSLVSAAHRLRQIPFNAVLACTSLSDDPFDTLSHLKPLVAGPVLLFGAGELGFAVEAMRRGADDVLTRGVAPYLMAERLAARLDELSAQPLAAFVPGRAGAPAPARQAAE
jgi:DNA-binding response OmpR family regulator